MIAALFLPMYRLWHYLLYAAAAVGAWAIGRKLFPGTVEEVEMPPDTGDKMADSLIEAGRALQKQMRELGGRIHSPKITESVGRLCDLTGKIYAALERDPGKQGRIKKFQSYYLPTTIKLLGRYEEMERTGTQDEILGRIEDMMQTLETAYQKQLDNMYEADAVDISADIRVMQQMMAAEGLLESDF